MKKFCLILVIAGISLLFSGGHVTALPNPDPSHFAADDGTEIFIPSDPVVSIEVFDFFGSFLPSGSTFGFFFEGSDLTDPNNLITIFDPLDQDPDPSGPGSIPQIAVIGFSDGIVLDMDLIGGGVQSTFTGTGNIGFFLDLPGPTPSLMTTVASLNPGGLDLAATFPVLAAPNAYLIGFEVPGFSPVGFDLVIGVEPIPEPGTLLLLGSALAGFVVVYRKKFKK